MTNERMKNLARMHNNFVLHTYKKDIEESVLNTHVYRNYDCIIPIKGETTNITLVDMDTISAAFQFRNRGHVALLNFASYKNPGGKYLEGSTAQEENLCHGSCLFEVLSRFDDSFYAWNREHLNYGLYTHAALYSENVWFDNDTSKDHFDVITCACPNMNALQYHENRIPENEKVLRERAEFIIKIASKHGPDVLILGAWGCGVFKQDPKLVASAFMDALKKYKVKSVVFAIPRGNANYTAFERVISHG